MFGFLSNIGPWELVLIGVIALIVVGPGKLPELGQSAGKAIREFQRAKNGLAKDLTDAAKIMDQPPAAGADAQAVHISSSTQV